MQTFIFVIKSTALSYKIFSHSSNSVVCWWKEVQTMKLSWCVPDISHLTKQNQVIDLTEFSKQRNEAADHHSPLPLGKFIQP